MAAARDAGVADRLLIVPPLEHGRDLMDFLAMSDIQLDTYPYGGWTTNMEAVYAGLAIVTQEGQTVNANQSAPTIIKLAQVDVMTVKAQISEADVTRVQAGQKVYFTILGEPDRRFEANEFPPERSLTSERKDVSVDFVAIGYIEDAGDFYRATGGSEDIARSRLEPIIKQAVRNEPEDKAHQHGFKQGRKVD